MINDIQGGQHLKSLADKIVEFQKEVNAYQNNNNPSANGYIAEVWHQFTLEIDALSKRTGETASIPPTTFASTDVQGSWGEGYQLKYCKDAWSSAKEQSTTYKERYYEYLSNLKRDGKEPISIEEYLKMKGVDPDIDVNLPIYEAQTRLIPADQLEDAKIALQKKIWKELNNLDNPDRAIEAKKYQDVLDKLTDHIESPKGAKSMPLTQDESKVLQSLAKEGKFDPSKYDITLAKKADYLYLTHSTINAGLNGALYGAMFKALPYLLKSITALVKEGKIEREQLEALCKTGVSGGTQGFIQGFSTALLKNCCMLGYFGEELQSAALQQSAQFNNAVIIIVTTTVETLKDTIRMTNGDIDIKVFTQRLEKRVFIASFSYMSGVYTQGIMPYAPVIGYLLGSFIGSVLGGFVFEAKERAFMSICIHSGFTFFGFVEQDYELPSEVKDYLGIESMDIEQMPKEDLQFEECRPEQMIIETMNFETMDVKWAKRGVVGIRKIGYIAVNA